MAYRADIEIAVRGARELDQTIKTINKLNNSINVVNRNAKLLQGKNFNVANIENYSRAVSKAERAVRKAAEGTDQERAAIARLVSAMELENKARQRKNILIAQEVANRRRVQATVDAGVGIQGPQAAPIRAGRGPASPIGGAPFIPGSPAALRAAERGATGGSTGGTRGRFGDVASNAIIGGAFPLLFGQGGGAATGGAIGGAVGGLFGGAGGFAGSLLGTLIGDIASQGAKIKELAADIGFSAEQTKILEGAFARAGREAEKFEAAVQNIRGLGLSLEDQADAINLAARLTEQYGGKVDKVAAAYANFVEKGKVGIADINKFTAQGVPILEELEKKYGTNRDGVLALAKDGKITAQELSDALVKIAQTSDAVNKKVKTGWDKVWDDLSKGASMSVRGIVAVFSALTGQTTNISGDISSIFSGLYRRLIEGAISAGASISRVLATTARGLANYAATIELGGLNIGATAAKGALKGAEKIFTDIDKRLQEVRRTSATPVGDIRVPGQAPDTGRERRPKQAPENRTAQLMEELRATIDIGKAEDRIRDLRFQGRDILAAQAEFDKQIADIQRDKNKALMQANYETERVVINKIAEARTTKATLELEDQIREIKQQRFEQDMRNKDIIQQTIQPIIDFRREQELQLKYSQNYYRLIKEGMLPAEAERIINFEQLVEQQLYAVEQQITLTESAILEAKARGASTVELDKQLKLLKDQQKAIKGEAAKGPGEGKTDAQRIEEALGMAREELANLTDPINQVIAGAKAIGDAFQQAFMGLVSGAMTGQEALASFFKGVGEHFLDMAAKMIAKLIEIWILQTVLGFIGGAAGSGGGGGGTPNYSGAFSGSGPSFNPGAFTMPKLAANGAYWPGGFQAFADGGLVTRPTMGLVGEGGEPEYIIPASKMRGAMERYAAGARGSSVIPANGNSASEFTNNSTSAGGAIDVRYTIERINSVDYVTAEQFQKGMQDAVRQGAAMGQRQVYSDFINKRSIRQRLAV